MQRQKSQKTSLWGFKYFIFPSSGVSLTDFCRHFVELRLQVEDSIIMAKVQLTFSWPTINEHKGRNNYRNINLNMSVSHCYIMFSLPFHCFIYFCPAHPMKMKKSRKHCFQPSLPLIFHYLMGMLLFTTNTFVRPQSILTRYPSHRKVCSFILMVNECGNKQFKFSSPFPSILTASSIYNHPHIYYSYIHHIQLQNSSSRAVTGALTSLPCPLISTPSIIH